MTRARWLLLVTAGCATTSSSGDPGGMQFQGPAAYGAMPREAAVAEAAHPWPKIVSTETARGQSQRSEAIHVPYGTNQDGNELVLTLLERARDSSAVFLGDLEVVATFKWGDARVECRTRILFEGDPALTAAPPPASPPGDDVFKPQRVTSQTTESQVVCSAPGQPCKTEQVAHKIERYDFEEKLGFVPPDWSKLSRQFSERALVAAPPVCSKSDDARLPPYRLSATAYFRGR